MGLPGEGPIGLHQELRVVVLTSVVLAEGMVSLSPLASPSLPYLSPAIVGLLGGLVLDCRWLRLRKRLTRRAAVGLLWLDVLLPLALALWLGGGVVVFLANLFPIALNMGLSHLRERLPPR